MFTKEETYAALVEPQIGDYFIEMSSYRFIIVGVDDTAVKYVEAPHPHRVMSKDEEFVLPYDGRLVEENRHKFVEHSVYRHNFRKPWVRLIERNVDVAGWLEHLENKDC